MTTSKYTPRGIDRRTLLKISAATSAMAAAGISAPAIAQARPIKIGYVSPATGPLAAFAAADQFMLNQFRNATKNGLKGRPIQVILKDSQSNPNRAAQVAKDLIVQDKIDLMLVGNTPETTNPVATQCEIEEVACVSSLAPWQPWFIGQQANPAGGPPAWKPFNYIYHYFWGLEDVIAVFTNMWNSVKTNKVVGGLFPNDADGNAWGDPKLGLPPALAKQGYKLIDPGRYQNLTNDFSAQIAAFKKANCEIVTGNMIPPDFKTFWTQARQQGFRPKVVSIGKALLFAPSIEALGDLGDGLTTEVWWGPTHPFKSSLTGQSSGQLVEAYEKATKRQWAQSLGFAHALFEVAADVLKRTKDLNSKPALRDAIAATRMNTIVGRVAWEGKPVKNVTKTPLVGGQWVKGKRHRYELIVVNNDTARNVPKAGQIKLLA